MRDLGERLADGLAGGPPPVIGVLLHPCGPDVVERIFGLADRAQVSAKVQQDGFHGAGSDIDAEQ
jgi:hypothetical protein